MKKLIQISLIAILALVLFQAVGSGSAIASGQADLGTATHISSMANTTSEDVQMAACLVTLKVVICAIPNVGWNS
jgi:hypothetical protein